MFALAFVLPLPRLMHDYNYIYTRTLRSISFSRVLAAEGEREKERAKEELVAKHSRPISSCIRVEPQPNEQESCSFTCASRRLVPRALASRLLLAMFEPTGKLTRAQLSLTVFRLQMSWTQQAVARQADKQSLFSSKEIRYFRSPVSSLFLCLLFNRLNHHHDHLCGRFLRPSFVLATSCR